MVFIFIDFQDFPSNFNSPIKSLLKQILEILHTTLYQIPFLSKFQLCEHYIFFTFFFFSFELKHSCDWCEGNLTQTVVSNNQPQSKNYQLNLYISLARNRASVLILVWNNCLISQPQSLLVQMPLISSPSVLQWAPPLNPKLQPCKHRTLPQPRRKQSSRHSI